MDHLTLYSPGHLDPYDSYGLIACRLIRHLTELGVTVNALAGGKRVVDNQPPEVRAVTERDALPVDGHILLGYPIVECGPQVAAWNGPRLVITMFESSRLKPEWVQRMNEVDAVIVPSHFCAQVFCESGVTVPVYVVPLGVSEAYQYAPRPTERPLTFLAFLDRGPRKGGNEAIQAFVRAFGEDMDYRLILKSRTVKESAPKITYTNPNFEMVQRDLSESELAELYRRCHILINPHRGEGFGLLPREFAATGGVALTTGWSGTADGLDFWGVPIPYRLERAGWQGNKSIEGQDVGEWATVDPNALAELLWQVVENWPRQQSRAGMRAEFVAAQYRWPCFAGRVLEIYRLTCHASLRGVDRVAEKAQVRA